MDISSYFSVNEPGFPGYTVHDDDDDESDCVVSSSEDDIDIMLHGTPEQKRRVKRRSQGHISSSEDEFEKQMEIELDKTIQCMHRNSKLLDTNTNHAEIHIPLQNQVPKDGDGKSVTYHHNNLKSNLNSGYHRSPDGRTTDSANTSEPKGIGNSSCNSKNNKAIKEKKNILDDMGDLFYDEKIDEENQRWADNKRKENYSVEKVPQGSSGTISAHPLAPLKTDAILNCPACMTSLCSDCQRHTTYTNQYRAMFVTNCVVDKEQFLSFPSNKNSEKSSKKKEKGRKTSKMAEACKDSESCFTSSTTDRTDMFNPVKCEQCNTEVGVFDSDEVYHFFNVIASYG